MPTSSAVSKTRFYFWMVFVVLYALLLLAVAFAPRVLSENVRHFLTPFAMPLSFVITTLFFRIRGAPIIEQSVQVLEKKTLSQDEAHGACEMHMSRKSFQGLFVCFGAFCLVVVCLMFAHPPKATEWIAVGGIFGFFGVFAVVFAALGWLRPSFVARVDEQGVTAVKGWSGRNLFPWSQIESCQRTQTDLVATNSAGLIWQFKNKRGQVVVQITPFDVPKEQQDQFAQFLTKYMTPSDLGGADT